MTRSQGKAFWPCRISSARSVFVYRHRALHLREHHGEVTSQQKPWLCLGKEGKEGLRVPPAGLSPGLQGHLLTDREGSVGSPCGGAGPAEALLGSLAKALRAGDSCGPVANICRETSVKRRKIVSEGGHLFHSSYFFFFSPFLCLFFFFFF